MNNSIQQDATKNENSDQVTNCDPLVWEAPKLYKEDWLNTLTGKFSGKENGGHPERSN